MCMRVSLRKPTYVRELLYIILTYSLNTWLFALRPSYTSRIHYCCLHNPRTPPENVKKWMFLEFWVVLVVMQLTHSVVTTFSLLLSLHKCINRGREVHESNWDSHSPHLFPIEHLLVLQSLEAEFLGEEKQKNQINLKRRYICTCFQD